MLDKLVWAFRLLRSRSFVLLTDKQSVVMLPLADVNKMERLFIISSQTTSLYEFKERLEEVIDEHEQAAELLLRRKVAEAVRKEADSSNNGRKTKTRRGES